MESILYTRDHGPQCFEAAIISQHDSAATFIESLRACQLFWYWHSDREEGHFAIAGQPELPGRRPLTLLTDQNLQDLVLDIDEIVDVVPVPPGEHRTLMLFGLSAELTAPIEAGLEHATQQFLKDIGPLEVVFSRIQDLGEEFLYFRRQPMPQVRKLLNAWQLDPDHPAKARPYEKLRVKSLMEE